MSVNLPEGFVRRHIGSTPEQLQQMLSFIGCRSLDELMEQAVPAPLRSTASMNLSAPLSEHQLLRYMRAQAAKNKLYHTYIGMGYYNTLTPPVIQRNLFENPGWYTPYTPYQAEIAQGRLECLLNFQTMVSDLTALEVANASLLDEATAAVEAMLMLWHSRPPDQKGRKKFFLSANVFPQTQAVLIVRAEPLGIEVDIRDEATFSPDASYFGALLQYPDGNGRISDYSAWVQAARQQGVRVVVASDLLALTLLKPPGEWGADVCFGSSQRFGVPLGYGGPHAAFFSARREYLRHMPGRIIGVSVDAAGKKAYRMTLQTREQHIKREKATSNICTAQALLANMAVMYAIYHGPNGLKRIASSIHRYAIQLRHALQQLGYAEVNGAFFDTLKVVAPAHNGQLADWVRPRALEEQVNLRYFQDGAVGISLDETVTAEDLERLVRIFSEGRSIAPVRTKLVPESQIPEPLMRRSPFLTHPVFNSYHSETKLMRYLKELEDKDLALNVSMIPLGSCTMKLNAAAEMIPTSYSGFAHLHPFVPLDQAQGYQEILNELEQMLCQITGMDACSLQPNSGAQGELTGLLLIRAYHRDHGQHQRQVALIPASAHGTNPASASLAGMKVIVVKSDAQGNIDLNDLKNKAHTYRDELACLMVTYPSTHGIFEQTIVDICALVHDCGGLVYMDGANMNAQVGLMRPAALGADVVHLNLHKTFSIPHGGGGPGAGPICVVSRLAPYLPSHPLLTNTSPKALGPISAAPWGSASILLMSYAYLKLLGSEGITLATKTAILHANYMLERLKSYYRILYTGQNGRCAHEFIIDLREFKKVGIDVEDVAKRLMDYGFHAPTVSFPVVGTLMIEPTESEDKSEIDRYCDALISIRQEIDEIASGTYPLEDNVLKNAPHTIEEVVSETWVHAYTRQKAVFPLPYLQRRKFWPSVARINNTYGDRNVFCVCPPVDAFADSEV